MRAAGSKAKARSVDAVVHDLEGAGTEEVMPCVGGAGEANSGATAERGPAEAVHDGLDDSLP